MSSFWLNEKHNNFETNKDFYTPKLDTLILKQLINWSQSFRLVSL